MSLQDALSISAAAFLSLGGGAAIVFALSRYLGTVWAARILEDEKAASAREHELLVRRRNIYAALARGLRVFLTSSRPASLDQEQAFLSAYDEAALWATEDVAAAVGVFIDMAQANVVKDGSVSEEALKAAYIQCITAMRRDSGFFNTEYKHRVVSF